MNSFIEYLNEHGGQFVTFAWPMLWQSSLLIALVLAVDLSLARKVRASVRHALWLVVLVKLLLPPTLALPTGVTWWLFPAKPVVKATPTTRNYTVTFDNPMPLPALTQEIVAQPLVLPPPPPRAKLDGVGWTLLGCIAVSATLLAWLLFRWWQLARTIRAAVAPNQLETVMVTARQRAQLPPGIRLKLVDENMSPAVCGLFRPVILLPRRLVENLSAGQLQAVLLHEAIHLRRKDIWVNCAQALLQIVYWWHPLVWVANARIRRVREEAVDDAVMLALAGDAETYAPTLLEVAKLALNRPLMSLGIVGIVGIMETRSALRQRIERLVNFRAPRKAGLTFLSLCGIFVFSAVAVPMGQGPAREADPQTVPNSTKTTIIAAAATNDVGDSEQNKISPQISIRAQFYRMSKEHFKKLTSNLAFNQGYRSDETWLSEFSSEFDSMGSLPVYTMSFYSKSGSSEVTLLASSRIQTLNGRPAWIFIGDGTISMACTPTVDGKLVNLAMNGQIIDEYGGVRWTNRFQTSAAMENLGGAVVPLQGTDSPSGSNLVAVLNVSILSSSPLGHEADFLVQDGKWFLDMGKPGKAAAKLEAALKLDPKNATADYYLKLSQHRAEESEHGTNMLDSTGPGQHATHGTNMLIFTGAGQQAIRAKLDNTYLGTVSYDGLPLNEVLKQLSEQTKLHDPEHKGINFLLNNGTNDQDVGSYIIKTPMLTNVRLVDMLDTIAVGADHPLKYTIRDFAVIFSEKSPETPRLFTRAFQVNPNSFLPGLEKATAQSMAASSASVNELARAYVMTLGVDLNNSPGKSVFFDGRLARLVVTATKSDLNTIENALQTIGTLSTLDQPGAVEHFGEPEVTTISGRQTRMRATSVEQNILQDIQYDPNSVSTNASTPSSPVQTTPPTDAVNRADELVRDGKVFYEAGDFRQAEIKLTQAINLNPGDATARYYLNQINQAKISREASQNNSSQDRNQQAPKAYVASRLIHTGPGRQAIMAKLDKIHLESVSFNGLPLNEVLKQLSEQTKLNDPEHKGVNFLINDNPNLSAHPIRIDTATGQPVTTSDTEQPDIGAAIIKIPHLTDVRLADVLDAIVLVADHPIRYSAQEFGIMFYAKDPENPQLFTRTFHLDPNTFYSGLENVNAKNAGAVQSGGGAQSQNNGAVAGGVNAFPGAGNTSGSSGGANANAQGASGSLLHSAGDAAEVNIHQNASGPANITKNTAAVTPTTLARAFFATLGVDLAVPAGKSVFFNDKLGILFVKATERDLDTIEQALQVLNQVPPQVHIKVRFVEVPSNYDHVLSAGDLNLGQFALGNQVISSVTTSPAFSPSVSLTNPPGAFHGSTSTTPMPPDATNRAPMLATFAGILTDSNFRVTLHALTQRPGVEVLGEPEITTLSGRQTQIRATHTIRFVTNFASDGHTPLASPQVSTNELGPILDFVPYVLADGYTINLALIPSDTEFDGYDGPTIPGVSSGKVGNINAVETMLPKFTVSQLVTTVNLWDNQTVVLGGLTTSSRPNKVPRIGDVPSVGDLSQGETNHNNLLIFVTATIVDPAGSRVHTDDQLPFAQVGTPSQPAVEPGETP